LIAALEGDATIVKILVDKGANLEASDGVGRTALMYASVRNYEKIGK
jgi:ankyrin repeat protein